MMNNFDEKYCVEAFRRLLAVDSTTGQYIQIQDLICRMIEET